MVFETIFSVRNALGTWKVLLDSENKKIAWKYIVNLYEYQKSNGFTVANKLTKQHVQFEKNKMKVKLAVQVLSQSVANGLLTMSDLKIPSFENVGPTVKYLQILDTLYDIMNSKVCHNSLEKLRFSKAMRTIGNLCSKKQLHTFAL